MQILTDKEHKEDCAIHAKCTSEICKKSGVCNDFIFCDCGATPGIAYNLKK